jgi:protein CpxP
METIDAPQTPDSNTPDPTVRQRRSRRGFLGGLAIGILGAGLVGFAIGATMPAAEAALGALAHGGFHHDGPPTPEKAREHAEFVVSFALHRLDATGAQEEQVQKIVRSAIDELFPVVEKHHANRDQLRAILGGATIDRSALEKLRSDELALADEMSRVVVSAVADTAETLTPAQRTTLLERLERFRHHR